MGLQGGTFKQGVSKQGVMTFAWRPGSQYDVVATRGADSVLASDYRAQFGRPSTRRGWRDNVLASKCKYPPLHYPPLRCARFKFMIYKSGVDWPGPV